MTAAADVSVIVPVRNGAKVLPPLLDALAAQEGHFKVQVIIVDNGSTDETMAVATAHPIGAMVLSEPKAGSYRARNAGAKVATAPVLAFTDGDCRPHPGWLAAGLAAIKTSDLVAGDVQQVPREPVTIWERYDATFYLRQEDNVRGGFGATANLFARRDAFDAVDGFEFEWMSGADHDFCLRVLATGRTIVFSKEAAVSHVPRRTARELWKVSRRNGAGWGELAKRGKRPRIHRDPGHWHSFRSIRKQLPEDGILQRRVHLYPAHALVLAARMVGRLSGR